MIVPEMNFAKKMLKTAEEKKAKRAQVLKQRKATNSISMIMDCLKFVFASALCIGVIIYLIINCKKDVNGISLFVSVMSAIIMLYSILVILLGKHKFRSLDTVCILIFFFGLIGALIIVITYHDNGIKSLLISAVCLCANFGIEMIKGIIFYVEEYKKRNKEIEEELNKIDSTGRFS